MRFRDLSFKARLIGVIALSFAICGAWRLYGYYDCVARIPQGAMGISPGFSYLNLPLRLIAAVWILESLIGLFKRRNRESIAGVRRSRRFGG